jgi:hypothetical protein
MCARHPSGYHSRGSKCGGVLLRGEWDDLQLLEFLPAHTRLICQGKGLFFHALTVFACTVCARMGRCGQVASFSIMFTVQGRNNMQRSQGGTRA